MKYLILSISFLCFIACANSNDEVSVETFIDCELLEDKYKEYNNETIDCQFHYVLTEYNNEQYIELVAHCADLLRAVVINGNCEEICLPAAIGTNFLCHNYLQNREVKEIFLIRK